MSLMQPGPRLVVVNVVTVSISQLNQLWSRVHVQQAQQVLVIDLIALVLRVVRVQNQVDLTLV